MKLCILLLKKNNQVELTDNGIKYLSRYSSDFSFFQILELKLPLSKRIRKDAEAGKRKIIQDFGIKRTYSH
jgi:preprotein translocase subunit SecA